MKKTKTESDETIMSDLNATQDEINAYKLVTDADVVPNGFRRAKEWGLMWKLKDRRTKSVLYELTKKGMMERKEFLTGDINGQRHFQAYWKLVKNGKKKTIQ